MPQHALYEPSNEFIQRHKLYLDEQEERATLWKEEPVFLSEEAPAGIDYHKQDGRIVVFAASGDPETTQILFDGFLPDEAALESILKWTNW